MRGRDLTVDGVVMYESLPKDLPAPGVLVLHEIFGLNDDIRRIADRFADLGYVAVAPDLLDGGGSPASRVPWCRSSEARGASSTRRRSTLGSLPIVKMSLIGELPLLASAWVEASLCCLGPGGPHRSSLRTTGCSQATTSQSGSVR